MKNLLFIVVLCISFLPLHAQGEAAIPFITLQQSPEFWGMGQTGVAVPNNYLSGFYFNPANLGYKAQNNFVGITALIPSTRWIFSDDIKFNSLTASAGINFSEMNPEFPFSVGVGIINNRMDFGTFIKTDAGGNEAGTYEAWDSFHSISIGIGYSGLLSYNFGFSVKNFSSKLSDKPTINYLGDGKASGFTFDFGFLIMAPLYRIITETKDFKNDDLIPKINTSIGYSLTNLGAEISYFDAALSDPLPRTARLGYTIELGLDYQIEENKINLLSYAFTAEAEDILIKRRNGSNIEYKGIFGDIEIAKHLVGLNYDSQVVVHKGHNCNLFESFNIYFGSFNGSGYSRIVTNGISISSSGIFKYLSTETEDVNLKYFLNHFRITYTNTNVDYTYLESVNNFSGINIEFINFLL